MMKQDMAEAVVGGADVGIGYWALHAIT